MSRGAGRGTILIVPILLLLAAAVILAGVVSVAMGHGGEMAEFASDHRPPDLATAADVALLRPPSSIWGYNVQITDEALNQIAQVITERDVEIAVLRQQLAELRSATGSHPAIAATLLARSNAARDRGASTREATAREATAREDGAREDGAREDGAREDGAQAASPRETSPGAADAPAPQVLAAGPPDPPSPDAEPPAGDEPRSGAGTGSGEAAARHDD